MIGTPQDELGRWLRTQRRARGWDVPTMARKIAWAAGGDRHTLPSQECLLVYIRRWERGTVGVSERYVLLYCMAFGIEPDQFGPPGWAPAALHGAAATTAPAWPALIGVLSELRDSFADDAKTCQARAEQAGDVARAALCRGQALAYTAAAENLAAVLAGNGT